MTFRKASSKPKKKRKLPYSFKELSARIMQTRTSGSAGQVLILARGRAAILRQKLVSGEYDDKEVESAILHADAMVRVARKRMKHLKAEEEAARGMKSRERDEREETALSDAQTARDNAASTEEENALSERRRALAEASREASEELARKLQALMEKAMEEMMEEAMSEALEETVQALGGGMAMRPEDLELLKKKHRAEEQRDIMEADMRYLKALFGRLVRERQSGPGSLPGAGQEAGPDICAVSLQLGGMELPVEVAAPADAAVGGSVDVAI